VRASGDETIAAVAFKGGGVKVYTLAAADILPYTHIETLIYLPTKQLARASDDETFLAAASQDVGVSLFTLAAADARTHSHIRKYEHSSISQYVYLTVGKSK
jgi:hypothetical protein